MKSAAHQNYQVLDTQLGKGTFANRDFKANESICILEGEVLSSPTLYTVQISANEHVVPVFGKYLNHSCQPNCYLSQKEKVFKALREVKNGEELSFDYNSTEYEMAAPFDCQCGKPNCYGNVKGYKFLSETQKEALKSYIPDYFERGV